MNDSYGQITTNRKDLYKEVWTTPILKLCSKYGLSNVGFAKLCRRNQIPLPPRGYWAKSAHGHHVNRTPLPNPSHNHPITIRAYQVKEVPEETGFTNIFSRALASEKVRPKIVVAETTSNHSFIKSSEKALRTGRDEWGRSAPDLSQSLDICVGRAQTDPALCIMEALVNALEGSGFRVSMGTEDDECTLVNVCGESISMRLIEMLHVAQVNGQQRREGIHMYPPSPGWGWKQNVTLSGLLCLELDPDQYIGRDGHRQRWKDGKIQRVKDCLNEVICGLIRLAAAKRRQSADWASSQARYTAQQSRENLRKRQIERHERILAELREEISAWKEANEIRAFVQAAEENLRSLGKHQAEHGRIRHWLRLAREYANEIDPLAASTIENIGVEVSDVVEGEAVLRDAIPEDYEQILPMVRRCYEESFGSELNEENLVMALQAAGCVDPELSLVAAAGEKIIGHVMLSNVGVQKLPGICGVVMAPLCVLKDYRRRTMGTNLVKYGIEACRKHGKAFVYAQGDIKFYGRFGFVAATTLNIETPFKSPHDMVLFLNKDRSTPTDGWSLEFPTAWQPFMK